MRFYRDFTAAARDRLMVFASLTTGDDRSPRLGMSAVFNGRVDEAQSILRPLREFGAPILDDIEPRRCVDLQKIVELTFPPGRLNY